jgi:hypothetical protein
MEKAYVVTYTEYGYEADDAGTTEVIGVYPNDADAQVGINQLYKERGSVGVKRYDPGRTIDGETYTLRGNVSVLVVPVGQFSKYGW